MRTYYVREDKASDDIIDITINKSKFSVCGWPIFWSVW